MKGMLKAIKCDSVTSGNDQECVTDVGGEPNVFVAFAVDACWSVDGKRTGS